MVLNQAEVEVALAKKVSEGKLTCYRCGKPIQGSSIIGLELQPADGKPKVVYQCENPQCPNHKDGSRQKGYRTLRALGIVDSVPVLEGSPLRAAVPPPEVVAQHEQAVNFDAEEDDGEDDAAAPAPAAAPSGNREDL